VAWHRLEGRFTQHPKVQRIPRDIRPSAIAFHVAAGLYSGELLTDGFVPADVLPRIAYEVGLDTHENVVKTLVENGLFDRAKGGYRVHDYLDYNPSAKDAKEAREKAAERKRRQRSRAVTPDVTRDEGRDGTRDAHRDIPLSRRDASRAGARLRVPVPSPKDGKDAAGTADAAAAANGLTPAATAGEQHGQKKPWNRHAAEKLIRNIGYLDPHPDQLLDDTYDHVPDDDRIALLDLASDLANDTTQPPPPPPPEPAPPDATEAARRLADRYTPDPKETDDAPEQP
jgi:hypothetical protein